MMVALLMLFSMSACGDSDVETSTAPANGTGELSETLAAADTLGTKATAETHTKEDDKDNTSTPYASKADNAPEMSPKPPKKNTAQGGGGALPPNEKPTLSIGSQTITLKSMEVRTIQVTISDSYEELELKKTVISSTSLYTASSQWGSWENDGLSVPLTITAGTQSGEAKIKIDLVNTQTNAILDSKTIKVIVQEKPKETEPVTVSPYPASVVINKVLYQGNGITVRGTKLSYDEYGAYIWFTAQNSSDKDYVIQVRDFSLNGYMISTSVCSAHVNSGKSINDKIHISSLRMEENNINKIYSAEFIFLIYDENSRYDSFESSTIQLDF